MRLFTTSFLLTLLVLALPGWSQPPAPTIGLQYQIISEPGESPIYKNFPAAVEVQGGFIVGESGIPQPYTIALYRQGDRRLVGFEKILSNQVTERPQGLANHQTIQVLDVANIAREGNLLVECFVSGKRDPEVFALVRYGRQNAQLQWIAQFEQVWRANRKTQRLERVRVGSIRCLNPGWGV